MGQSRRGPGGETVVNAEGYRKRRQELAGWAIEIESYKFGDIYYCTINNVDPGA